MVLYKLWTLQLVFWNHCLVAVEPPSDDPKIMVDATFNICIVKVFYLFHLHHEDLRVRW